MLLIDRLVLSQVDDKNETKSISESDDLRFMALSLLNWSLRPRLVCCVCTFDWHEKTISRNKLLESNDIHDTEPASTTMNTFIISSRARLVNDN